MIESMYKHDPRIDTHIAQQSIIVQRLLNRLRTAIQKAAPEAVETISYGIPTFDLYGHLVHFAGYKTHIGFYPGAQAIHDFKKDFGSYAVSKGAVQFPLDKPLPLSLVTKIVKARVEVNLQKAGRLFPKLSAPAMRALIAANIHTLKDLSRWSEEKLLELHGVGPSTLPPLRLALKQQGLAFKK